MQHWSQNLLFPLSLSLSLTLSLSVKQSVSRCMLSLLSIRRAKSPWETCETEDLNIVVTPNNSVFSRVCFEKSEISSRSGSSISSQKWSCRTRWAQNLCVHPTWPGSQNFSMQVRCGACPALSGRESSARIGTGTWCRAECAGAAKTGETWEGRRRDRDQRHTCNKHHFREHEPCVYVHAHENVQMWLCTRYVQKNVRATGECMYTSPSYTL